MKFVLAIFTLILVGSEHFARSQGFVNLDFESPILPLTPVNPQVPVVPIANALPGWQGYIGGNTVSQVAYDAISGGAAAISLQDTASQYQPIEGSYSVILQPSFGGTTSAAIGQTGQIPLSSKSLTFYSGSASMEATFDGNTIPLVQLGMTGSYLILGGDISSLAGQTGELRFTMPEVQSSFNIPYLDNIQFSVSPVPEPGPLALFATGALLLAFRRRRNPMS